MSRLFSLEKIRVLKYLPCYDLFTFSFLHYSSTQTHKFRNMFMFSEVKLKTCFEMKNVTVESGLTKHIISPYIRVFRRL